MENTEAVWANYKLVKNTYKTKIDFEKNNFLNQACSENHTISNHLWF